MGPPSLSAPSTAAPETVKSFQVRHGLLPAWPFEGLLYPDEKPLDAASMTSPDNIGINIEATATTIKEYFHMDFPISHDFRYFLRKEVIDKAIAAATRPERSDPKSPSTNRESSLRETEGSQPLQNHGADIEFFSTEGLPFSKMTKYNKKEALPPPKKKAARSSSQPAASQGTASTLGPKGRDSAPRVSISVGLRVTQALKIDKRTVKSYFMEHDILPSFHPKLNLCAEFLCVIFANGGLQEDETLGRLYSSGVNTR